FTASVAAKAPGGGAPTGNVKFYADTVLPGALLGTGTLGAGGTTTVTTSTLSALAHNIIAVYQGDTNYATSQGSVSQVVNKDSTTTTVGGPAASVFGQNVTFTASVSANLPGAGTPTGRVTFTDTFGGTKTLGTALLTGGVALFTINSLTVGNHTIMAS